MKKIFIIAFILGVCFSAFSGDQIVNKVIYKKIILDFDQISLINVYLNPMNVKEINVFFNGTEIKKVYKNLNSLVKNDDNFFPSFNFEVSNVKKENYLQIFVTLSQGTVMNSEMVIYFEKGLIVDDVNFQTKEDRIFFIKAADVMNEGIIYDLKIENRRILEKIDEIIKDNVLYYKIKALKTGFSKLEIYRYDESLSVQQEIPFKTLKITVTE